MELAYETVDNQIEAHAKPEKPTASKRYNPYNHPKTHQKPSINGRVLIWAANGLNSDIAD